MTASVLHSSLKVVLLLGVTLIAFKLYFTGLYRRYPILFIYFILRVPGSLIPILFDVRSDVYFWVWLTTEPIFLVFHILVAFELYRLVLQNYKGLLTVGRWAMYVSSVISLIISGLSLAARLRLTDPTSRSKVMGIAFATYRAVDTSLAIILILLLLFLSRYPISLSRNVRLYAIIFPVFFLGNTSAILMRTFFGVAVASEANGVWELISAGSVVAWLLLLNTAGELVPTTTRRLSQDHEARLLAQLDALNTTILGVSRR